MSEIELKRNLRFSSLLHMNHFNEAAIVVHFICCLSTTPQCQAAKRTPSSSTQTYTYVGQDTLQHTLNPQVDGMSKTKSPMKTLYLHPFAFRLVWKA